MGLHVESDLHRRRRGRNIGLALVLAGFVALVFGLSVAKIRQGDLMQAFDHRPRASVLPADPAAPAPGPPAPGPSAAPVAPPGTPAAAMPNAQPSPARGGNP